MESLKSFGLFFHHSINTLYGWIAIILTISSILSHFINISFINIFLPAKHQGYNMSITIILMIVAWCFVFLAAFQNYHKLRMKKVEEGLKYIPEAMEGKVFRKLYLLYREGLNCEKNPERQQSWDNEIIIMLTDHFNDWCKFYYLQETKRRPELNLLTPLNAENFTIALSYVEKLINLDFNTYFKS